MGNTSLNLVLALAMGFAVAGVSASGYRLATSRRLGFAPVNVPAAGRVLQGLLLVFGGPLVILGNCWRAVQRGFRPAGWLVATAAISSAWSLCLGIAMLNVLVLLGLTGQ